MEARRSLSATPMKNWSKWLICAGNLFHKNAGFVFFLTRLQQKKTKKKGSKTGTVGMVK